MTQSVYVILSHRNVQLFVIKITIILSSSFIYACATSATDAVCLLHNPLDVVVLLLLVVPKPMMEVELKGMVGAGGEAGARAGFGLWDLF
jgi:hypothetical protein